MDIMGSFPINGVKTYPITALDDCSRMILACCLYTKERAKEVVYTSQRKRNLYNILMMNSPRRLLYDNEEGYYNYGDTDSLDFSIAK